MQVPWATFPVDLGQLATAFPWGASFVLIRGVPLVTGSQVCQGPHRVGDLTIHDGNPAVLLLRTI